MTMQSTYEVDPDVALEGQVDAKTLRDGDFRTMYNGEASAKILFGRAVKWGSATDGKIAKLPAAESDKVVGLTAHSHDYDTGPNGNLDPDPDTGGIRPAAKCTVLRRGTMTVKVHTGCAPGDRGWVRAVAAGDEWLGAVENADDSTDMIDCTAQIEFLDYAAADGLARVAVDFANK
jgi:hypothetical protein